MMTTDCPGCGKPSVNHNFCTECRMAGALEEIQERLWRIWQLLAILVAAVVSFALTYWYELLH